MLRWLVLAVAALFIVSAAPAQADVFVFVDIFKVKTVTVFEDIDIVKTVTLNAEVVLLADKAAEALALINQINDSNEACEQCAEKKDLITDSINDNSGVTSVNQAAGNMNNQATSVAVAIDLQRPDDTVPQEGEDFSGFAEAQAAAEQVNGGESEEFGNVIDSINILFREATITGSINDNVGVVNVNQSVGNMNNQANAIALAVSLDSGVAMSEADLGQITSWNSVTEVTVYKTALIDLSILGNAGIVSVNQAAGNGSNQGNVVSGAFALTTPPLIYAPVPSVFN